MTQPHTKLHRVGVAGLGVMGRAMACRLIRAGFDVCVWNRTPGRADDLAEQGATVVSSASQLSETSDAVILMLSDEVACDQVLWSEEGLVSSAHAGLVVINCTTIPPEYAGETAKKFAVINMEHIDAPVTGSMKQAETGELFFLVGGDQEIYHRCVPLFEAMGRRHIHLGGHGMGACAKLGNNFMGLFNLLGFCEALAFTAQCGLDPNLFVEAVHDSGGRSAMSQAKVASILKQDWTPHFSLALAAKDTRLVSDLITRIGEDPTVAGFLKEYYERAAAHYGQDDVCALYRYRTQHDKSTTNL